jgi:hypothetical protein
MTIVGDPLSIANAQQYARTCFSRSAVPATAISTGGSAFGLVNPIGGVLTPFTLPVQVSLVHTSTAPITVCASQDIAPTITRHGWFSADSRSVYAAGGGACRKVPAGGMTFHAWDLSAFGSQAAPTPGARFGTCSGGTAPGRPCAVLAECPGSGAACRTPARPNIAYLFIVTDSRSAGTEVTAHPCL